MLNVLLVIALVIGARVEAQVAPPPESPVTFTVHTGAASLITRGERREYWAGRATLAFRAGDNIVLFARGDLLGTQDGGNLNTLDPTSFRSLETALGGRLRIADRLSVGAVGGVTYSIEGEEDAPRDPRLWTALGVVRYAIDEHGSYAYLGCGLHEPVGGGACVVSVAKQVIGSDFPVSTFVDFALPFDANAFQQKTYTLKVGASIKVWER